MCMYRKCHTSKQIANLVFFHNMVSEQSAAYGYNSTDNAVYDKCQPLGGVIMSGTWQPFQKMIHFFLYLLDSLETS